MDIIRTLTASIKGLITRGKLISAALYPRRTVIVASGLAGEQFQQIELLLPYGMSALPTAGDIVFAANMSYRSALMAIVCDDPNLRIQDLQPGEFGFRDVNGSQIVFRRTGIEVTTPGNVVVTAAGDATVTAGNTARLAGKDVVLHGSHSYSWDVNGFGERYTYVGGTTWEHKTWQDGSTQTAVVLPINPPEGP